MKLEQLETKVQKKLLSGYEEKAERVLHPYAAKAFRAANEIGLLGLVGSLGTFAFTVSSAPALGMACLLGFAPISIGILGISYAVNSYLDYKKAQKFIAADIQSGVYQKSYKSMLQSWERRLDANQKEAFAQTLESIGTRFDYAAALKDVARTPLTPVADFSRAAGRVLRDRGLSVGLGIRGKSLDLVNKIKKIVDRKA